MSAEYWMEVDGVPVRTDDMVAAWSADRTVAKDTIGGVLVSTVFLTIDHGFGYGAPVLYETMIFGGDDDGYCKRYSTSEAALVGHRRAADAVRSGRPVEPPEDDE